MCATVPRAYVCYIKTVFSVSVWYYGIFNICIHYRIFFFILCCLDCFPSLSCRLSAYFIIHDPAILSKIYFFKLLFQQLNLPSSENKNFLTPSKRYYSFRGFWQCQSLQQLSCSLPYCLFLYSCVGHTPSFTSASDIGEYFVCYLMINLGWTVHQRWVFTATAGG